MQQAFYFQLNQEGLKPGQASLRKGRRIQGELISQVWQGNGTTFSKRREEH